MAPARQLFSLLLGIRVGQLDAESVFHSIMPMITRIEPLTSLFDARTPLRRFTLQVHRRPRTGAAVRHYLLAHHYDD